MNQEDEIASLKEELRVVRKKFQNLQYRTNLDIKVSQTELVRRHYRKILKGEIPKETTKELAVKFNLTTCSIARARKEVLDMDKQANINTYKDLYKSVHGKSPKNMDLPNWTNKELTEGIHAMSRMARASRKS